MPKLKRLRITPDLVLDLCRVGTATHRVTANALPDDAFISQAQTDFGYDTLEFLIHSDTYPNVQSGEMIPEAACPELTEVQRSDVGPATAFSCVLGREQIREMLYECERTPRQVMTLTVFDTGAWKVEPVGETS